MKVIVRTMEDQLFITQHLKKRRKVQACERINNEIPILSAELKQADLLKIMVKAVRLRIHRDGILLANNIQNPR